MKVKCLRCSLEGNRFKKGFKMSQIINDWLCDKCFDLCKDEFNKFKENFIQPERSKREDQRCNFCLNPESILTPETCCNGCGALNIMET